MRNRPLCRMVLVYITGILIAFYTMRYQIAVAAVVMIFLFIEKIVGKRSRCELLFGCLILCMGIGSYNIKCRQLEMDEELNGTSVVVTGTIYQVEMQDTYNTVYLKNCVFYNQNNQLISNSKQKQFLTSINILAYVSETECLKIGNEITVKGKIKLWKKPSNEGQFDAYSYYRGLNIACSLGSATLVSEAATQNEFLQKIADVKTLCHEKLEMLSDEDTASVMQAMLLGEKKAVGAVLKDVFREGSIGHVLVVSGLHFSIAGMGLYQLLRRILGFIPAGCASCILLFGFGIMTGFGTSAVRAFVMFAVYIFAQVLGRDYDRVTALAIGVLCILVDNPLTLFLPGFLLSVFAILGILFLLPCFENLFTKRGKLKSGILSSLAIQLFSMPITLYYYFELNPYSALINTIVLPFMPVLVFDGVLSIVVGFIHNGIGSIVFCPVRLIIKGIVGVCQAFSKLPFYNIVVGKPKVWQILLFYGLLFLFRKFAGIIHVWLREAEEREDLPKGKKLRKRIRTKWAVAVLGLFVLLSFVFYRKEDGDGQVTMLDVGQGQCIYIHEKSGFSMLYDGGSTDVSKVGTYRITPYLKSQGCDELDVVMVSHTDGDHISGIMELLSDDEIQIDTLLLPDTSLQNEAYTELQTIAEKTGVSVKTYGKGSIIEKEGLRITGFHPEKSYRTASENDTSIVAELQIGKWKMLLCGDMESGAEQKILQEGNFEDVDILQVAHHGSKYSTEDTFLSVVQPEVSLISCGEGNSYGHPHEELVERLKISDSDIFITEKNGAVTVRFYKNRYEVESYCGEH